MNKASRISGCERKNSPGSISHMPSFFKPSAYAGLSISRPGDTHEQQADHVAANIMHMHGNKFSVPNLQKKSGSENAESLQRKENNNTTPSLESYVANLDSGGGSLSKETRDHFEPRFGYDFSKVKIHTDTAAARSAQSINSHAYTTGNHVVFNSGQFSPQSAKGKQILAHELTHVVQQNGASTGNIQRMTIGSGTPPAAGWEGFNLRIVPGEEQDKVKNAISMIDEIARHPEDYKDCVRVFIKHCPGNSPKAFTDAFNKAVIWRGDDASALARGDVNGPNIMYTKSGYNQGTKNLAQTLIHEMGHNCGITGKADHDLADVSGSYCLGLPAVIGLRFGSGRNSSIASLAFTYRRLFNLALGGQLQFTVGADLDLIGTGSAIQNAVQPGSVPDSLGEFELGSTTLGLKGRSNLLWGGENFGGLILNAEAGVDAGRFRVLRKTKPDEFEYGAGVVLQSTLGAEFYIPIGGGQIIPLTFEGGYRFIKPLNSQAKEIHEWVFGIGGRF